MRVCFTLLEEVLGGGGGGGGRRGDFPRPVSCLPACGKNTDIF